MICCGRRRWQSLASRHSADIFGIIREAEIAERMAQLSNCLSGSSGRGPAARGCNKLSGECEIPLLEVRLRCDCTATHRA